MRMPCSVSCIVSMMRVPPVNCMRAMLRTRRISLRRKNKAGGAMMKPTIDISGSCITITIDSPTSDIRSRPTAVMRRLITMAHGGGAGGQPGDEFGGMAVGKKADVLAQQLVEHAALVVGDDAVADRGEHHGRAVGRETFDGEDGDRDDADDDDGVEITVDIGLVGHRAEKVGAERRAGGGDPHQHEGDRVARPMLHASSTRRRRTKENVE